MDSRRHRSEPKRQRINDWERQYTKDRNKFKKDKVVGNGAYGCVFKAYKLKDKSRFYAIKKIRHNKPDGFSMTSIREIKLLKQLDHPNIIKLKDIITSRRKLNSQQMEQQIAKYPFDNGVYGA